MYVSTTYGDIELDLVVNTNHQNAVRRIGLASLDEFHAISHGDPIFLPSASYLVWLDPATFFGAERAILFAHRTTANRLLIIAFVPTNGQSIKSKSTLAIHHFIRDLLWVYIDNAIFGIELDALTAETGHLMGRAIAKVSIGVGTIDELLKSKEPIDDKILTLARQTVDDGLLRLELIRHNFYKFALQRRGISETDTTDDDYKLFDAVATIQGLTPIFQREAESRGLKPTRMSVQAPLALICGPESLLRLTFLNVYDNALKFSYANTAIDIKVTASSIGRLIISFQNLGIGVAPDETRIVFQRFRRSRFKDPVRRTEGLGLGLAYCRRVVEDIFKGTITLESRSVKMPSPRRFEGDNWLTTVTIEIPLDISAKEVNR